MLIKQGVYEIYFVNSHESFTNFVSAVYEQIRLLKIPHGMVTICSESADIKNLVKNFANKNSMPRVKSIWTRRFEHDARIQKILMLTRNQNNVNLPKTLQNTEYDKKFLLLNRRWRDHRPLLVALLKLKNILDLGHVSLALADDNFGWTDFSYKLFRNHYDPIYGKDIVRYLKSNITQIDNIPDLYLDTTDLVTNRAEVNINGSENYLYESTYFSVVTETNYFTAQNSNIFFSEKIFKPIMNRHPFMVVSTPGFLSKLKTLGYKTFSPWINENYDSEVDDAGRMKMIVEEIQRLSMLSRSELDKFILATSKICKHNYFKLMSNENPCMEKFPANDNLGMFVKDISRPDFVDVDHEEIISDIREKISLGHSEYVFYGARESISYNHLDSSYLNNQSRWKNYSDLDPDTKFFPRLIYPELTKIHLDIIPSLHISEIKKLSYVSSTVNAKNIYKSYCDVMQIPVSQQIKMEYDNFYGRLVRNFTNLNLVESMSLPKTHKFLCYNRMPHIHRMVLVGALIELDIVKHGKLSLYTNLDYGKGYKEILDYISEGEFKNCWHHSREFYDKVRIGLKKSALSFPWEMSLENHGDNPTDITLIDYLDHASTFFSIITETGFYNRTNKDFCFEHNVYLTEKTYKAIKNKHPFVIVGSPNSLLYLQRAGFKTFEPYIDERYDLKTNDEIRMQLIIKEIQKLCNMSMAELSDWKSSMNDILEYNYNILQSLPRSLYE